MDNLKCLPYWEEFYSSIKEFGEELLIDTTANKTNRKSNYHSKGGWEAVQEKCTHSNDDLTYTEEHVVITT